eukprot:505052_1
MASMNKVEISVLAMSTFAKIFYFWFDIEFGKRMNIEMKDVIHCSYNYYFKSAPYSNILLTYLYENVEGASGVIETTEISFWVVHTNGNVYKTTISDDVSDDEGFCSPALAEFERQRPKIYQTSTQSWLVDECLLSDANITNKLTQQQRMQLISILMNLQINITQNAQDTNSWHYWVWDHVIKHCGKSMAQQNGLYVKHYKHKDEIDNEPLREFMINEIGMDVRIINQVKCIKDRHDWNIKIDNFKDKNMVVLSRERELSLQ